MPQAVTSDLSQAMSLGPGARLGKYELLRPIAIGGMAEVYLACAAGIEGFERRVVIKRILPHFSVNTDFVQMFLDEARLTAMLDHPNIVQVHDIGNECGSYYLTMEYIRGQDVRSVMHRARSKGEHLPLSCVTTIGLGMAAGLHHAHDATDHQDVPLNIIHRDVSLSNILVSYDGTVKVVDFGIAKAAASNNETRTGVLKGKISYMSPEQCKGKELDRRSDVFAMGIVLYEMATCTRLFAGANEFSLLQKILYEDVPPPSSRRADLPKELDRIILKALRRNRDERYGSALELQEDLHAFARTHAISTSTFELAAYMASSFCEDIANEPSETSKRSPLQRHNEHVEGPRLTDLPKAALCKGSGENRAIETSMFEVASASPDDEESDIEITMDCEPVRRGSPQGHLRMTALGFATVLLAYLGIAKFSGETVHPPAVSVPKHVPSLAAPAVSVPKHVPSLAAPEIKSPREAEHQPLELSSEPRNAQTEAIKQGVTDSKFADSKFADPKFADTAAEAIDALEPANTATVGAPTIDVVDKPEAPGIRARRAPQTRRARSKRNRSKNQSKPKQESSWNANSALLPSL